MCMKKALAAATLALACVASAHDGSSCDEHTLMEAVSCGDIEKLDALIGSFGSPEVVRAFNHMIPADANLGAGLTLDSSMYCFDPARPPKPEVIAAITQAMMQQAMAGYDQSARWPGTLGSPITLTWSLVPDGTQVPGLPFEPSSASDMVSQMDAKFAGQGGRATWIAQIQSCFDRWSALTGVTFTRERYQGGEWDDGNAMVVTAPGFPGLRGDIRIGGRFIDNAGGILALSKLPDNGGDVVLDTFDDLGSPASAFRTLRNIVMHELGHSLGMLHMCSSNTKQLMEPFLDITFDGPQHDDIRNADRMYGDSYEPNDSLATATNLGVLTAGQTYSPSLFSGVPHDNTATAISVNGETDFFQFTINAPTRVQVQLWPRGFPYDDNTQQANGTCNSGTVTQSLEQADLTYSILDSTGAVRYSVNSGVLGQPEFTPPNLDNLGLPGVYYIRVGAVGGVPHTQNYELQIMTSVGCAQPVVSPTTQIVCVGGTASFTAAGIGQTPVRWRHNGVDIPNSDTTTLTLTGVTAADAGTYVCDAGTPCGHVLSDAVTLTVTSVAPTITSQPSAQIACAGNTFTLSISADNASSYQWRRSGAPIAGATGPSYSTVATSTDSFSCVVSNGCGSTSSTNVSVTVFSTPTISAHPTSQTVCLGQPATFSVAASGGGLSYLWYRNGTFISDAHQSSLTIASATGANEGAYTCEVSNSCSTVTSAAATLSVVSTPAPVITSQPASQTLCAGQAFSFTVAATSTPAPTYQWRRNSVNIAGATNSTYSATASSGNSGTYTCAVSNPCGSTISASANLTVNSLPSITVNPSPQSACLNSPASFAISATGPGSLTLSFQWRRNGTNIASANSATYAIPATNASTAGTYDCVVTNSCGSTTSSSATLTLLSPPTITTEPASIAVCPNRQAAVTVVATGASPLSYQWRFNGNNLPGATNATFSILNAGTANLGNYTCVITNSCGTVTSAVATLTHNAGLQITSQPTPQSVCPGGSATFSIAAAGEGTFTYQWRFNSANIPNSNSATLVIPAVGPANLGNYDCLVSNVCGLRFSSVVALTFISNPAITADPTAQSACIGYPATFSVAATGSTLAYQWRRNGSNIPGASNSSYTIPAVDLADLGNYDCIVSNTCGSTTSNAATLSVNVGPNVTSQPSSASVIVGQAVSFSVAADGTAPLDYQWRRESVALLGATSTTYSIATSAMNDAGSYDCVITNPCGSTTSNAATLTVGFCVADTDDGSGAGVPDGGVTIDDLLYYLVIFEVGDIESDVDDGSGTGTPDGGVTIDDLLYYLQRFEAGC